MIATLVSIYFGVIAVSPHFYYKWMSYPLIYFFIFVTRGWKMIY